jgi:hypothetical protein
VKDLHVAESITDPPVMTGRCWGKLAKRFLLGRRLAKKER